MKTLMKNLLKPLSLALFVAATLPTQNACNQTSPSSNPPTQTAHIQTSPPSNTLPATSPSPSFCKAIGGESEDEGYSLIQTSDGGYAIAGYTKSFGAGEEDVYVVKLDAKGNLQWTKTIGGPASEKGNSLIQTSDGGYAITGYTKSFGAGKADVCVVKLDASGNLQWTKTIGGPKGDYGNSIIQTSDGGYAIAGFTRSFGAGSGDVYVVKLDANGNLQWTKTIGGKNWEEGNSLIQTSDGGYAIAGSYGLVDGDYDDDDGYVVKLGDMDVYVVKLDANGNLQWTKTIGGKDFEAGHSLIQTSDGGYAIAGFTRSFGAGEQDVYVVKLDASGNLQWTKTIGGPASEEGHSLIQTSDGGYAIAGYIGSFYTSRDYFCDVYVVKLNANGNLQWTITTPVEPRAWVDEGHSLIQTSDGGYAFAGETYSFGAGEADVYIVKLDKNDLDKNDDGCCVFGYTPFDLTPQVGSGGRLGSPTSSIGSGGTLTSPTPSTSSGGTLTNQCP